MNVHAFIKTMANEFVDTSLVVQTTHGAMT